MAMLGACFGRADAQTGLTYFGEMKLGDRRIGPAVGTMLNEGRPNDTSARLVTFTTLGAGLDVAKLPFHISSQVVGYCDTKDLACHEFNLKERLEMKPLELKSHVVSLDAGYDYWTSPSGELSPPQPLHLLELGASTSLAHLDFRGQAFRRMNGGGWVALPSASHTFELPKGWKASLVGRATFADGFPGPGDGWRYVSGGVRVEHALGKARFFAESTRYHGLNRGTYIGPAIAAGVQISGSRIGHKKHHP